MTDPKYSTFGIMDNCYDLVDYELILKMDSSAVSLNKQNEFPISMDISEYKSWRNQLSRNELRVFKSTEVSGRYYVNITLNFASERSDCYFIEMDKDNNITRTCKSHLIY